jgi:hypothetical protein
MILNIGEKYGPNFGRGTEVLYTDLGVKSPGKLKAGPEARKNKNKPEACHGSDASAIHGLVPQGEKPSWRMSASCSTSRSSAAARPACTPRSTADCAR